VTVPPSQETTLELLRLARDGDQRALDTLFGRYRPKLQRWACSRLPRWARDIADTQDLVQETLLHTFRRLMTFEVAGDGALLAYMRQATLNRIRDEIRRSRRRQGRESLPAELSDDAASPLEQAIGRQRLDAYEAALARLRPSDRELLVGRLELGFDYNELAQMVGKPTPEAARKAAQRALFRLATEMKCGV